MKIVQWFRDRPFLTSLIVFLLVLTPGYAVMYDNANDLERLLEQDQADRLVRCQESNDSRMQIRQTFFDAFAQLLPIGADPAFIEQLNDIVPAPEDSDLDCDGSGTLDEGDYS